MGAAATANWMRSQNRILVASSDPKVRERILGDPVYLGVERMEASGGAHALARLKEVSCDGVLLDRNLADLDAGEVAELIRREYPAIKVSWIEAEDNSAVMPTQATHLTEAGKRSVRQWDLAGEAEESDWLPGMIGRSAAMREVYRLVRLVAKRDTTVLIHGETGTGKELVAEAIHGLSLRAKHPFVVVNCAAIPEALLGAELFGHARGAFTGAVQSRLGRIHIAQGGTLFLDEVGELPLGMQAKLLRFLQSGEVQRLGSSDMHKVDVRVICATNARLCELVEAKLFRMDLYYRLAVFPIALPALAERGDDVDLLAEHFLAKLIEEDNLQRKTLEETTRGALRLRRWPGNVRELQHAMERAFILSGEGETLRAEHFPA